jgi:hypothetical protein
MPVPRLLRTAQRKLAGGVGLAGAAGSPAISSSSVMVVRYPEAIDTPPTITDDVTPLAGQWHNYLGLLIEAVIGELGPLGTNGPQIGDSLTLKEFLGVEGGSRLSLYRSVDRSGADAEAGQLFGVMKLYRTGLTTFANTEQITTVTNNHGADPMGGRTPVAFACSNSHGQTGQEMRQGPTIFRAACVSNSSATTLTVRYRAATGHDAGNGEPGQFGPTNLTHSTDILLIFMGFGL